MASRVPPNTEPTPAEHLPAPPSASLSKPADWKNTFKDRQQQASKFMDPCEAAAKASQNCMERTHYNRDECLDFFQVYKDCKSSWLEQRRQDRRAGRG
ncbi:hypothetical protein NliqN6_4812 [Naganishia liquefaciens]|uniref:Cytochrome c oxidase-assembly factor COX23, mitochondrial n=1 Tax=Naganishia liquefaciens TaxID=104408 RepID=A0A8H3TX32_9TREE|nr:hypothetical protein NliqN6_4812 [Naganishia liquefaciens]